ncbi:MAG: 50S ribosomal protein L24 [Desulfosarcina sp.]|nr:50S ribosomal protein L24 [Desulfosarcina sp.]MBC2767619.1 50S ribosomal protein L24 [Desulfosarcina sp.]
MIRNSIKIKKDDKVKILAGKDKGKVGKVLKIIGKKNRLLIENINIVKRHTKPNAQNRQGGILESEAPIHWSNVMLMCNKCIEPVLHADSQNRKDCAQHGAGRGDPQYQNHRFGRRGTQTDIRAAAGGHTGQKVNCRFQAA